MSTPMLRRQGISRDQGPQADGTLFKSDGKVTAEDIAIFARQLATMLHRRHPDGAGLRDRRQSATTSPAMQKLIAGDQAATSRPAPRCTRRWPSTRCISTTCSCNLVEAGEQAGALETVLDKIATYKEKTEALKKKIKKALFYPAAVHGGGGHRHRHPADLRDPAVREPVQGLRRRPAGVHPVRDQPVALDAGLMAGCCGSIVGGASSRSPTSTSARDKMRQTHRPAVAASAR
ncbi:MAG: type II secretion system F family protein [Chromatiales bacterium]|nr:type II secretion system F family protein [Chromatiales bacterium]